MSRNQRRPHRVWGGPKRVEQRALELSAYSGATTRAEQVERDEAAVALFRRLTVSRRDRNQAALAGSLFRLADHAWETGDKRKALTLGREAATTYRAAARVDRSRYLFETGRVLVTLGCWQREAGRTQAALDTFAEAADLYRLVPVDDSTFSHNCQFGLGVALQAAATTLHRAGRSAEALTVLSRTMDVFAALEARGAGAPSALAEAWRLRADILRAWGDDKAAAAADEEVATARRVAVKRRPRRSLPDSLHCLDVSLHAAPTEPEAETLRLARVDEWLALAGDVAAAADKPTYPDQHRRIFKLLSLCHDRLAANAARDGDLARVRGFRDAQVELAKRACWAAEDGYGFECCAPNNPCWVVGQVLEEARRTVEAEGGR